MFFFYTFIFKEIVFKGLIIYSYIMCIEQIINDTTDVNDINHINEIRKQKQRERSKKYYDLNKEKVKARTAEYSELHPEIARNN